jgi:DNA-binding Xre family transcriptional regulator
MTKRIADYRWNLRQVMASHNLWKTTQLAPLLAERGVNLSPAQIYRLVTEQPERLSLRTLAALCDIFDCTPNDLIDTSVETAPRKTVINAGPIDLTGMKRPVRAQILPDSE